MFQLSIFLLICVQNNNLGSQDNNLGSWNNNKGKRAQILPRAWGENSPGDG